MSIIEKQITNLLERKQKLEALHENKFTETHRWLVDATSLLLEGLRELREDLRDRGVLR